MANSKSCDTVDPTVLETEINEKGNAVMKLSPWLNDGSSLVALTLPYLTLNLL